ncbi:MAG: rhodanese-like domain-containing protein [Rhodothermaceae bacterium]|nr:rhodanese-like domain-containing protein [Rhodothermaceae bacterium]
MSFFSAFKRPADPYTLSAAEFQTRLQPGEPVLDVRTPAEYADGHLAETILVDVMASDFNQRIEALLAEGALVKEQPVYLYCRSGNRSGTAARRLREMGFSEAYNVGGFNALAKAGLPTTHG